MAIEALKDKLPDFAKDLRLNLSNILSDETLTEQQLLGTILASALAARSAEVIAAVDEEATQRLTPEAYQAAKAAAAIMAMNNIYYRFTHLAGSDEYRKLPAKLRMNVIARPGVEKADFELWSLAVSAINGCGACIAAHEAELRKAGMSAEQIQTAVRIAAIIHAIAATIDGASAATRAGVAAAA